MVKFTVKITDMIEKPKVNIIQFIIKITSVSIKEHTLKFSEESFFDTWLSYVQKIPGTVFDDSKAEFSCDYESVHLWFDKAINVKFSEDDNTSFCLEDLNLDSVIVFYFADITEKNRYIEKNIKLLKKVYKTE